MMGLFLTLLLISGQRSASPATWRDLEHLCGRFEYEKKLPVREGNKTVRTERKSLRNVELELYPWDEGQACCEGVRLIRKVVTGRSGRYDFKEVSPGRYWIVARWQAKAYQLAVTITQKHGLGTNCSEQGFQIDSDGKFDQWLTITVD